MMKAVSDAQSAAEAHLVELSDDEYVEACDELESYFSSCAMTKREELKRDE